MLHITESAAQQLRTLAAERALGPAQGLRLSVEKGGCAGLQYDMQIADQQTDDEIAEAHDARVFVAADSRQYFDGCTLDYTDDLAGAGFRVINPRAARSCGCGTSFEPADAEATTAH